MNKELTPYNALVQALRKTQAGKKIVASEILNELQKEGYMLPLTTTKEPGVSAEGMRDKFFDDLTRVTNDGTVDFNCLPYFVFDWMIANVSSSQTERVSEEEIKKEAKRRNTVNAFVTGAKWMQDRLSSTQNTGASEVPSEEENATPNRIQIAESMAKECVDKIVSSEWVDIKNRHMVELAIRNTMSEYHSSLSRLSSKQGEKSNSSNNSSSWISVEDRLPKKRQDVLWSCVGDEKIYRERYLVDMLAPYYVTEYTHWQPLPPPPKEEEKKEEVQFYCSDVGNGAPKQCEFQCDDCTEVQGKADREATESQKDN